MRLKYKFSYYNLLPILSIFLALIGLLFIYSASFYSARINYGDAFYYVKKQSISLVVGIVCMIVASKAKTEIYRKIKWVLFVASMILLALVFIPGLGMESYGATRWINLGFFTFQPSEFSKFGFMMFLAGYLSENPPFNLKNMVIPVLTAGIICGLIMAEPNMSITVVVGCSFLIMLFTSGIDKKWLIFLSIIVIVAGVVLIIVEPYRLKRLLAFLDPWQNPKAEGYQLIQSYYAIGSGGLFGVGLFKSKQKYLFLPFAESDFIFSVIAEETGFVGALFVMAIFLLYFYVSYKIIKNADNRFDMLLGIGITAITLVQTVVNFAVVTGCIPPTGVPLPFISAGGSSLVAFMFGTGILYNIARNHSKKETIII